MRFNNWDLLLLPLDSIVPLQEFRTDCSDVVTPTGITPTMTTFIPSLPRGTPIKFSLHTWTKPALTSPTSPAGNPLVLALHVSIDGNPVVIEPINFDTDFPHVITTLRFPAFHKQIRHQVQLHVADNLGRITASLSEGYFYPELVTGRPRFHPIRDIVCFKWMHAPLRVLQNTGVAWPSTQLLTNPLHTLSFDAMPTMPFPIENQSITSQDSGFYSTNLVNDSDSFNTSEATVSPAYVFGGSLADSIHAPPRPFGAALQAPVPVFDEGMTSGINGPQLMGNGISMFDAIADDSHRFDQVHDECLRKVSDISMHPSCDQYPECVVEVPGVEGVLHKPRPVMAAPSDAPTSRKRAGTTLTDKDTNYRPAKKIYKPAMRAQEASREDVKAKMRGPHMDI